MLGSSKIALLALSLRAANAAVYNTFDGEGFPSCYNVTDIHEPTTVDEMASLVKDANSKGLKVRAAGKGHMW